MARTIKITDTQWNRLNHLRMSAESADVFRNCTIILMSALGRSKALHPVKPPGRPCRAGRTGRRIVLVMDQGNHHQAKALHRHMEDLEEHIDVFWLTYYSPELNLIERL